MENNQDIAFNIFLKNFKKQVSKIGLKNSIQKDYILKVLYFSKKHLTAEEISNEIKSIYNVSIGIATVYRAMKFFHDMKLVNQLDIGDGILRYELNLTEHHDHLICTNCGKIIEFNDDLIELNQIKIATKNNFILKEHVMTIYGLCEDCQ
ncbi:MAG: Fur family transcriptional regulator [Arcobacter sp.]|jgi:Fur family ferric uptake transcriptional regulator|uniref:Ferric uptake regulation protein n=1 Tax=Arcobacter defluvii TaxID=873191 RepID=A0AAE7BFS3_9BACT|nr:MULTISPECIES: transcriptional repressor [Arcobacter]MDY3201090.1 transcriptional repressor [Arcobacter sp.]QKF76907.1 transcriptional regulator, Fur family [Arcobacter defluvii]RXI33757.1 transcriptional repressor [Arcobacter defluvii]BAK72722.1 ferric uptake regulation protein [Arcobacter sp. L]